MSSTIPTDPAGARPPTLDAVAPAPLASLFAHQGGWDEFLFAAGPIALIGGLLWLANKRAKDLGRRDENESVDAATAETLD